MGKRRKSSKISLFLTGRMCVTCHTRPLEANVNRKYMLLTADSFGRIVTVLVPLQEQDAVTGIYA